MNLCVERKTTLGAIVNIRSNVCSKKNYTYA